MALWKTSVIYSLDIIISVGYRVHSQQGVAFRQWASRVVKDYIINGYAIRQNMQVQHYNS